jgi:hypothetical protein
MTTKRRIKAGMIAVALAFGTLLVSAPNASASGNCYHYGTPGYAQIFTDGNYNGDCFEWWFASGGTVWFPSYIKDKASSIRIWSGWPGHGVYLRDTFYGEARLQVPANAWFPYLETFNDIADYAELGPLQG